MTTLFTPSSINTQSIRRERVFLLIAGLFLGTLGIINILGVSRFVDLSFSCGNWTIPMIVPVGVLPYPITFLCTDIICEFYGKQRANLIVWIGLIVNIWILFILWLGGYLPPDVPLEPSTGLPAPTHSDYAFYNIRIFTAGSVFGSMLAYLVAQFLDVHLFHFWKKLTQGKHLWLRNNASTIISQLFDTVIVTSIVFYFTNAIKHDQDEISQLTTLILCSYTFKVIAALLDTLPFYVAVFSLRRYFGLVNVKLTSKPLLESNRHSLNNQLTHF
jgi:uncharacterized integral membrane protein (TIGR00697 family)